MGIHDGSSLRRVSPRDLRALRFIGEGHEVAQYQLHEGLFAGRTDTIVSRFVRRWVTRGAITVERSNRTGINRLRLTQSGADLLIATGGAYAGELFIARRPVALKDLAHVLWINDLRVGAFSLPEPPDLAYAAWSIQRRLHSSLRVVPDLLAVWKPRNGSAGMLIACEVDIGGESLRGVFVPKLRRLAEQIYGWAGDAPAMILILTATEARATTLGRLLDPPSLPAALHVRVLPRQESRARIQALRSMISELLSNRQAA
jgi:hypothetical protein